MTENWQEPLITQGTVWGIDSFDQWGVELGKQLATTLIDELISDVAPDLDHDASTNALIHHYRRARGRV